MESIDHSAKSKKNTEKNILPMHKIGNRKNTVENNSV